MQKVYLLMLLFCCACSFSQSSWDEIKELESQQKYAAAMEKTQQILENAQKAQDNPLWTRALIHTAVLQRALHGYEKAVLLLHNTPWPEDSQSQAVLHLFYANTLFDYYYRYSWEINNREKVVSDDPVDIKKWSSSEIFGAISEQYSKAYKHREALGKLSVKSYSNYIQRNGYPDDIRSTMRDFLVYSWVNFFSNTTTWTPEQSQEKYRVSLDELLLAPEARQRVTETFFSDKNNHPMTKAVSLLDGLYFWNQQQKNTASALETQLEKLRKLQAIFNEERHRDKILQTYPKLLESYQNISWWSAGMFDHASLLRSTGDAVAAHKIAQQGHQRYPDSLGGKKCFTLVKSIEAPGFSVSTMFLDRANARSLEVWHKNMDKLHFRAYPINFEDLLNQKYRHFGSINTNDMRDVVYKKKADYQWEVSLNDLGDYQNHKTYVTPPVSKNGLYVIAASAKSDFSPTNNQLLGTYMLFSNFVIKAVHQRGGWEIFVVKGDTGERVSNATVSLYKYDYNTGCTKAYERKTNDEGYVFIEATNYYSYFVVAQKDNELTYDPSSFYFYHSNSQSQQASSLLYTDRSIYRPLQKLYFKVIAYSGDREKASYRTLAGRSIKISFHDPNGKEIENKNVTTNDYGTASGEFMIPKGRILGQYYIRSQFGNSNQYSYVRVEEYKRPTFEVSLDKPSGELHLNQDVEVTGEARYYFGLPVTEGKISYRVIRTPQYPYWYWWYYSNTASNQQYEVAAGKTQLDNKGKFKINFVPKADTDIPGKESISYRFQVYVEITNEGGETRNAENTYNIGFVSVKAAVSTGNSFFTTTQSEKISVVRQNLDGMPRAGAGLYRLCALQQPAKVALPQHFVVPQSEGKKYTKGDLERPRWEYQKGLDQYLFSFAEGKSIASGELQHNKEGKAEISLPQLAPGAYRVYYETKDSLGNAYKTQKEFLVAGETTLAIPLFNLVQKNHVKVGEQAQVFLGSGIPNQPLWLEIYQSGSLISRRYIQKSNPTQLVSIPIEERHRGGFVVSVRSVHDYRMYNQQQSVYVPWDNKQLQLSFSSFRNLLRPGQKETWSISVKGPDSQVVSSEVLAYMYDRSLDFFTPHNYPNIQGLYPSRSSAPQMRSSISYRSLYNMASGSWYVIPSSPNYYEDSFIIFNNYPIGGVGTRRQRFFGAPGGGERLEEGFADLESAEDDSAGDEPMARSETSLKAKKNGAPAQKPQVQQQQGAAKSQESPQIRSNFSETAFFYPHLVTNDKGEVSIEFQVPDSVTEWNVYAHAITKDLHFMTLQKQTVTRKDLMVRPYVPRFFRENDEAVLKVVIDNTTKEVLSGEVELQIMDLQSKESKLQSFGVTTKVLPWKAEGQLSTNVSWKLRAPNTLGTYAFQVVARSKSFSDGELRPVPVLPSRIHLSQSKFITLKDNQTRVMELADLSKASEDKTLVHNSLVVNVNGQLIYTVLKALPYLVQHPYECVEQTLNRFLSTSIVTSMYDQYPVIRKMGAKFSERTTQLDPWNKDDANRKLALEETPWLVASEGGLKSEEHALINILNPQIAQMQKEDALQKLREAQLGDGAFPWWAGGPASAYMTLYLLHGFAKAREFKVEIPEDMITRAWNYMGAHFRDYYAKRMIKEDYGYEFITFLNYVLSCYPESVYQQAFSKNEREEMLVYSFAHWKKHNPYTKALLSMTLHRAGRPQDAQLVIESIMDSAVTKEDQGTFWAPEDRGWLWYNDTIESHAFILRALMEVKPKDSKLDGLVLWLLLNKKMNQWKSTRATAEVVYSLVKVMQQEGSLAVKETATVTLSDQKHNFVFEPDEYTGGQKQIVVNGADVTSKMGKVTVNKEGKGYMFASMNWHYSTEKLPEEARGDFLSVTRKYFLRKHQDKEYVLVPIEEVESLEIGDQLEVHLSIRTKHPMEYVHLKDPRGAGFEPENQVSRHRWDLGIVWYEEVRDSGANFFFSWLPQGEYTFKYRVRANMAGKFRVGPATLQSMYAPEFSGFSSGKVLSVK